MPGLRENLLPKLRRLKFSIESTGLRRTFMDVVNHLTAYHAERDIAFDRKYRTDTAGRVNTSDLGIEDAEQREKAILYLPSPVRVTRWMLDNVGVDPREFVFVDLGCGKGRVVLTAAQYPFQRVVGVEISQALSQIAQRNAVNFSAKRCGEIAIANSDATSFDFPAADTLLHLYHPFEPDVTAAVLARLEQSLRAHPRRLLVAYLLYSGAVPAVREVFSRFPWLRETRYEHSLFGHYDWLFFSN
ncbi:MAG TPA: class I SAM-dependent methyltransferase [Polyangiaceae bacterium]|nr:class I SAM-dependent methyltransferase [Polyangiaceae bacterium]